MKKCRVDVISHWVDCTVARKLQRAVRSFTAKSGFATRDKDSGTRQRVGIVWKINHQLAREHPVRLRAGPGMPQLLFGPS